MPQPWASYTLGEAHTAPTLHEAKAVPATASRRARPSSAAASRQRSRPRARSRNGPPSQARVVQGGSRRSGDAQIARQIARRLEAELLATHGPSPALHRRIQAVDRDFRRAARARRVRTERGPDVAPSEQRSTAATEARPGRAEGAPASQRRSRQRGPATRAPAHLQRSPQAAARDAARISTGAHCAVAQHTPTRRQQRPGRGSAGNEHPRGPDAVAATSATSATPSWRPLTPPYLSKYARTYVSPYSQEAMEREREANAGSSQRGRGEAGVRARRGVHSLTPRIPPGPGSRGGEVEYFVTPGPGAYAGQRELVVNPSSRQRHLMTHGTFGPAAYITHRHVQPATARCSPSPLRRPATAHSPRPRTTPAARARLSPSAPLPRTSSSAPSCGGAGSPAPRANGASEPACGGSRSSRAVAGAKCRCLGANAARVGAKAVPAEVAVQTWRCGDCGREDLRGG